MPAGNNWWLRQLLEHMKEVSRLDSLFKNAQAPNIKYFDEAYCIFEECCKAYALKGLGFEDFVEIGKSLRARQASVRWSYNR